METETLPILSGANFTSSPIHKGFFQGSINAVGEYRKFKMEDILKKTPYTIVPITSKDKDKVINFLRTFFFRDEPLNVAIGLLEEPNSTCPELEEYCVNCIPDGVSLMAVSSTGHLLGVCLNGILTREKESNSKDIKECSNPKFRKILQFLSTVTKRTDIFGHFPNADKILEIVILSVDESCRGQGICKALVEKTRDLAKEHNFPLIKVDCSSHFSAKAVVRLGFHCIHTLQYADYLDSNGERIFKTEPPHSCTATYVLPLY